MLGKKFCQKLFIGLLVKKLFKAITAEDVLRMQYVPKTMKPKITFQDKTIEPERMIKLIEDAEAFESSFLWKLLENNIRYSAQEKMFPQSNVDNDLLFGKAMLYNLQVIKNTIEKIKEFKF